MKGITDRIVSNPVARRLRILELRKAGKTYREIADELGMVESQVRATLTAELEKVRQGKQRLAEEVFYLEVVRLDEMFSAIYPKVLAGEESAIRTALLIMERRAKLLGLDRVGVAELPGGDSVSLSDEELLRRVAKVLKSADVSRNGSKVSDSQAESV